MTSRPRDAKSHRRTRRDHSLETAEDYVKAVAETVAARGVCRVVDSARTFAVSHVTVTRIVARLKEAGLLQSEPYGPIALTAQGKKLPNNRGSATIWSAASCWPSASTPRPLPWDAEGIEHHVSKATLKCFQKIVSDRAADK